MAIDPDELLPRKSPVPDVVVPRDLSRLSVAELEALIATLTGEIERLKSAIDAKRSTRSAADAIFKR